MNLLNALFSFQGRLNRAKYWGYSIGLSLVTVLIIGIFSTFGDTAFMLSMLIFLPVFIAGTSIVVRRLHDLNKSGWWYFGSLIPIYNIYLSILLMFIKGTDGSNDYGNDPLTL